MRMVATSDHMETAIVKLARAPFEQDAWLDVLRLTALASGSRAGHLIDWWSNRPPRVLMTEEADYINQRSEETGLYQAHRNYFIASHMKNGQILSPFTTGQVFTSESMRRDPLWQEFYLPLDMPHIASIILDKGEGHFFVLSIARSARQGEAEDESIRALSLVARHMRAAAEVENSLRGERVGLATQALGLADVPAFAVNWSGRVVHLTAAAERLLIHDNIVRVTEGRLTALFDQDTRSLHQAITGCCEGVRPFESPPHRSVTLRDSSGGGRVTALVAPCPAGTSHVSGEVTAIVIIRPLFLSDRLAQYGLSPSETTVAHLLAKGMTIAEMAHTRGTSRETIKSQTKSLYTKLGVRGQTELIYRFNSAS